PTSPPRPAWQRARNPPIPSPARLAAPPATVRGFGLTPERVSCPPPDQATEDGCVHECRCLCEVRPQPERYPGAGGRQPLEAGRGGGSPRPRRRIRGGGRAPDRRRSG